MLRLPKPFLTRLSKFLGLIDIINFDQAHVSFFKMGTGDNLWFDIIVNHLAINPKLLGQFSGYREKNPSFYKGIALRLARLARRQDILDANIQHHISKPENALPLIVCCIDDPALIQSCIPLEEAHFWLQVSVFTGATAVALQLQNITSKSDMEFIHMLVRAARHSLLRERFTVEFLHQHIMQQRIEKDPEKFHSHYDSHIFERLVYDAFCSRDLAIYEFICSIRFAFNERYIPWHAQDTTWRSWVDFNQAISANNLEAVKKMQENGFKYLSPDGHRFALTNGDKALRDHLKIKPSDYYKYQIAVFLTGDLEFIMSHYSDVMSMTSNLSKAWLKYHYSQFRDPSVLPKLLGDKLHAPELTMREFNVHVAPCGDLETVKAILQEHPHLHPDMDTVECAMYSQSIPVVAYFLDPKNQFNITFDTKSLKIAETALMEFLLDPKSNVAISLTALNDLLEKSCPERNRCLSYYDFHCIWEFDDTIDRASILKKLEMSVAAHKGQFLKMAKYFIENSSKYELDADSELFIKNSLLEICSKVISEFNLFHPVRYIMQDVQMVASAEASAVSLMFV